MTRSSVFCVIFCRCLIFNYVTGQSCNYGTVYNDSSGYKCFWLTASKNNFTESQAMCRNKNFTLAVIPDQRTLNYLNTLRTNAGKQYSEFYIGYKVNTLGHLVTLSGEVQQWAPWYASEPSGSGDCVSTFNTGGTFWDEDCSKPYYAICQWPDFTVQFNNSDTTTVAAIMQDTTTNSNQGMSAQPLCVCACRTVEVKSNLTSQIIADIARNISKELLVSKANLSSTIRSKTSAADKRPSATGIGCIGVVIMAVVFVGIVVMDAPVLLRFCRRVFKRCKKCPV